MKSNRRKKLTGEYRTIYFSERERFLLVKAKRVAESLGWKLNKYLKHIIKQAVE